MATANSIMNRAGKMLKMIEPGGSLSVNESADFFVSLNAMIESWQLEKLMIYDVREDTKVMVSGQVAYTIGSGGSFNIPRPVKIESLFVSIGTTDYPPMREIQPDQYAAISSKTVATSSIPDTYKFDAGYPLATVTIWPAPNAANTLHLRSYRVISAFAAQTDSVTLPPGYEDALAYNLAIREAPAAGKTDLSTIFMLAKETKAAIKRANLRPIIATTPTLTSIGRRGRSDIYAGG